MGNDPVGDHEDEEKEITKSPTDAFVKHAKEESVVRDLMISYLPFTIIGYLLILLFFSAIFSPLMAFLFSPNCIYSLDCHRLWDLQDC